MATSSLMLPSHQQENLLFPTFPEITGLALLSQIDPWIMYPSLDQFQKHGDNSGLSGQGQPYVYSWTQSPESFKFELRVGKGRFVNWNQDFAFGWGSDWWQEMQWKKGSLRMKLIWKVCSAHSRSINKIPKKTSKLREFYFKSLLSTGTRIMETFYSHIYLML